MPLPASIPGLSIADYVVFAVMLLAPLGIGAYHAITGNKTTDDFLLAGKSMSPIPVALSMTASFISSISILGIVGEVYGNGLQLIWGIVGGIIGIMIAIKVFLPVIYPLRINSINEYIERRFRSHALKMLMLLQLSATSMMYLGLCLFAPTLALEAVTPISSETYIVVLGLVVTIYSSIGGMKAVVWTDAFQTVIIILGIISATIASLVEMGGFGKVWSIASKWDRTDALDVSIGLYTRHTIFNLVLMNTVNFMSLYSFGQVNIQRTATMPDIGKARLVMYMNLVFQMSTLLLLYVTGLCIFAVYAGCDPLSLGYIERKDQIFPFYVVERLGFLKGVPGLFISCLFSGTMSSISSLLNSLPTMLWIDLFSKMPYFMRASENVKTIANKIITFLLGLLMIGLAFTSSRMGGLIQATATLLSMVTGPAVGVFMLGTCAPICSKLGAGAGCITSLVFMAWLCIGTQLHGTEVQLLPLSTDQCPHNLLNSSSIGNINTTIVPPLQTDLPNQNLHPLAGFYGISYTYLSTIGALICFTVGIVVSLITGKENMEEIDPSLVISCMRKYVGPKQKLTSTEAAPFMATTDPLHVQNSKQPPEIVQLTTTT